MYQASCNILVVVGLCMLYCLCALWQMDVCLAQDKVTTAAGSALDPAGLADFTGSTFLRQLLRGFFSTMHEAGPNAPFALQVGVSCGWMAKSQHSPTVVSKRSHSLMSVMGQTAGCGWGSTKRTGSVQVI